MAILSPFGAAGLFGGLAQGRQEQENYNIAQQAQDTARLNAVNAGLLPAKQLAATAAQGILSAITDPERFGTIRDQGLMPFLQDMVNGLGATAQTGDWSHVTALDPDKFQQTLALIRGPKGAGGTGIAGVPAPDPGALNTPAHEALNSIIAGGSEVPTSMNGAGPTPATPPVSTNPNGYILAPDPRTVPQPDYSQLFTYPETQGIATGDGSPISNPASQQSGPPSFGGGNPVGANIPALLAAPEVNQVDKGAGSLTRAPAPPLLSAPPTAPAQPLTQPVAADPGNPLNGTIATLAAKAKSLVSSLPTLDAKTAETFSQDYVNRILADPGYINATNAYNNAVTAGGYSPTMLAALNNQKQDAFARAATNSQLQLTAAISPYLTRESLVKDAAGILKDLGSTVESAGTAVGTLTTAALAPKIQEETARHQATQDQIDEVKPILARIDQRWNERELAANSLGMGGGVNVNIFGAGGGITGNLTQAQRRMAAQMSTKQMISDVLSLRELGLRGNSYAGAVADGYLKSLRAEYNANPGSVDVVPPTEDTLTGLDYIHSTAAQRAKVWSQATPDQRHQINTITTLAKSWEGQSNPKYAGPKYQDVIDQNGTGSGTGGTPGLGGAGAGTGTGPLSIGGQADQIAAAAHKHILDPIGRRLTDVFGPLFGVYDSVDSSIPGGHATSPQQDAAYQKIVQTAVRGIRSGGLGGTGKLDLTPVWSKVPKPAGAPDSIQKDDAGGLRALYYYMTGPQGTRWGETPPPNSAGNWLNPWGINANPWSIKR